MNKMIKILFIIFSQSLFAQNQITLEDCLNNLIYNSEEYKNIIKSSNINELRYNIFKNTFLPSVSLDVDLPSYDHSISKVTQFNGEDLFVDRKQASTDFSLTIDQPITFTGGIVSVKSTFNRLDLLSTKNHSYSTNWFNVILVQPLNGYNQFKWSKKINKLYNEKSKLDFISNVELLRIEIIEKYFDFLTTKFKLELTKKNLELQNNDLFNKKLLFEAGRILETEYIQLKISINQLKFDEKNQEIDFLKAKEDFKNLLNINNENFDLILPSIVKKPLMPLDILIDRIKKYNINLNYDIKLLEAENKIAESKSKKGLQSNLQIAYGFNSQSNHLNELYDVPSKREFLNLNLKIPLIDWNKQKNRLKIAETEKEIIEAEFKATKETLTNRISEYVKILNSIHDQLVITNENMNLSKKNSELSTYQFKVNRLTLNNYQYELFKEETNTIEYINNIRVVWLYRYQMRSSLFYDFYKSLDLLK